ncbi:MAG: hypothetical protein ACK5JS_05340 [Mangrovibacterium sp.]
MKYIFKIFLFAAISSLAFACNDDDDNNAGEQQIDITTANISGIWQLKEWNGEAMKEGLHMYIDFDRTDETFTMYDNIGSMYTVKSTGMYWIEGDDFYGYTLNGMYDYSHEEWQDYTITSMTKTHLELTIEDSIPDVSVYVRCDTIPQEIIAGFEEDEE